MPEFEIDHGEPAPKRALPAVPEPSAAEREHDERLRAALPGAIARIADGARVRHLVDMWAVALAGLAGQGLSGIPRTDPWTSGATLGVLAALAGLGVSAWMWRRSRMVADALWTLPVPLDDSAIERMAARDEAKRASERRRREEELARIEMLGGDLDLCRKRLHLAVIGAAAGSVCGWLCALAGPSGLMAMAASVAAVPGAVIGWMVAGGGWPLPRVQQVGIGVLPACALLASLLGGTPILYAIIGAAVAAGAAFALRSRIAALAAG